jgi:hypothetical protein
VALFGGFVLRLVMVAMMLGVELAGLGGMVRGMGVMAVRDMSVVRGLLDIVVAMLRGGVTVMLGGLLVMLSGALVMFGDAFFRHFGSSPSRAGCP